VAGSSGWVQSAVGFHAVCPPAMRPMQCHFHQKHWPPLERHPSQLRTSHHPSAYFFCGNFTIRLVGCQIVSSLCVLPAGARVLVCITPVCVWPLACVCVCVCVWLCSCACARLFHSSTGVLAWLCVCAMCGVVWVILVRVSRICKPLGMVPIPPTWSILYYTIISFPAFQRSNRVGSVPASCSASAAFPWARTDAVPCLFWWLSALCDALCCQGLRAIALFAKVGYRRQRAVANSRLDFLQACRVLSGHRFLQGFCPGPIVPLPASLGVQNHHFYCTRRVANRSSERLMGHPKCPIRSCIQVGDRALQSARSGT